MPSVRAACRRPPVARCTSICSAPVALLATLTRRELDLAVRRGCPSPAGDRRCAVVERPPPSEGYAPTAPQRRWSKARDRGCRHPGCRNKAGWTDLDHVVPHADGGPTDCGNLCCLCRRHHRLKTHAAGWSFRLDADGALWVTTPSGVTRVSRPPGTDWSRTSWGSPSRMQRSSTSCRSDPCPAASRRSLPMTSTAGHCLPVSRQRAGMRGTSMPKQIPVSGSTARQRRPRSTTPRSSRTPRSTT